MDNITIFARYCMVEKIINMNKAKPEQFRPVLQNITGLY